jgi:hypothetical protein
MASWIGLDVYREEDTKSCLGDRYGLPSPTTLLLHDRGIHVLKLVHIPVLKLDQIT